VADPEKSRRMNIEAVRIIQMIATYTKGHTLPHVDPRAPEWIKLSIPPTLSVTILPEAVRWVSDRGRVSVPYGHGIPRPSKPPQDRGAA